MNQKLMKQPLNELELARLEDWAAQGYEDKDYPLTKGSILRLINEVKELRMLITKDEQ